MMRLMHLHHLSGSEEPEYFTAKGAGTDGLAVGAQRKVDIRRKSRERKWRSPDHSCPDPAGAAVDT
jgi:hypothetical protein